MHDQIYWFFCQTPLVSFPQRETKEKKENTGEDKQSTAGSSKAMKLSKKYALFN